MDYQGGGDAGGFSTNSSYNNISSQGGGKGGGNRKSYDEQTLIPITAKMLLSTVTNSVGALALADGRELHQVKLIAAVRSVADNSTNITYEVEDGTGLVEIKQWNDDNDCKALQDMRALCTQEHVYIKCVGQIKDYDGKKTLVADRVRIVNSVDELTYHFLEVVYSAEKNKRAGSFVGVAAPTSMRAGVGFGGAPVAQASGGLVGDSVKDQVLNYIKEQGGELILICSLHFCSMVGEY
jgi:replication factor A2